MSTDTATRVIGEEAHKYLFDKIRSEAIQILYNSHITSGELFRRSLNSAWRIYEEKYGKSVPKTELVILVRSITSYLWKRRLAIRLSSPEFRKRGAEKRILIRKARTIVVQNLSRKGFCVREIANIIGVTDGTVRNYLKSEINETDAKAVINSVDIFDVVFKYRKPVKDGDGRDMSVLVADSISFNSQWWKMNCYAKLPSASVNYLNFTETSADLISKCISIMSRKKLLFVYTGHGIIGAAALEDEIMPWSDVFSALKARKKPLAILIDSCHSGSAVGSFKKTFRGFSKNAVLVVSSGRKEISWSCVLSTYLFKKATIPSVLGRKEKRQHPEVWVYDASTQEFRKVHLVSRGKNKRMIPLFSDKIFNLEEWI